MYTKVLFIEIKWSGVRNTQNIRVHGYLIILAMCRNFSNLEMEKSSVGFHHLDKSSIFIPLGTTLEKKHTMTREFKYL